MTDDQARRIAELQGRLIETVIRESDPENWSGGNTMTRDLDNEDRGNRYWCLKVAAQAVGLYAKLDSIIQARTAGGVGGDVGPKSDDTLDDEINTTEREAKKILARIQKSMPARDAKA